ncbi:hypothetical protein [Desulfurivibrio alkaliphilus]|uniref:Uncharacterized protein n=1 Tax=Desulfurivibrio alkaliphilus (strain DSM 19089 / UNIQEM U267 / AHT2) TaxID=589865 RepID=D6YZX4_DESAT|nr:hypothetical protein [Desulfurivibrio alkaliphilus]ADH85131.1 conserved hypothetical protein [Desulfurivibrio alkaliphilus AHT 2]
MTVQLSFSKDENELLPDFRNKISKAESTEDVKKVFAQTTGQLLTRIFGDKIKTEYEDIRLNPAEINGAPAFTVTSNLKDQPNFVEIWENSDLPHVVGRLAQTAKNRYKHLEKHPEKTNAKIRM